MAELATIARPYAEALFKASSSDVAGTSAWLDKVAAIAIRQLSVSEAVFAGGHSEDGDHSASAVPWIYSTDGAGMAKQLRALDLL